MEYSPLTAISPVDGRYAEKTDALRLLFSEYSLMRHRILIEIRWLLYLKPALSASAKAVLENLYRDFNLHDAAHIKNIEKITNHDVKAVEYFIKEKIAHNAELSAVSEWVHFGCTSEDINNLAYAVMLKTAKTEILLPFLDKIIVLLRHFAHQYADIAMLSRTHGQTATPTTLGKELANVVARLMHQKKALEAIIIRGKFNGAVGNFNAHSIALPEKDWPEIAKSFVESVGLTYESYTTQIEPHDYIAEIAHNFQRIHTVLIDLCRDIWSYVSLGYFKQNIIANEVGSSTMPHKINPIDFENAEGNFYLSNALFQCLAEKLPLSRWQRDLVDSTLMRNMGTAFGYAIVAYQSLLTGLNKLGINKEKIQADLHEAWEILAEPIQMIMRVHGIENAYEKMKSLTRSHQKVDKALLHKYIEASELPDNVKYQLKLLTPEQYIGYAEILAKEI